MKKFLTLTATLIAVVLAVKPAAAHDRDVAYVPEILYATQALIAPPPPAPVYYYDSAPDYYQSSSVIVYGRPPVTYYYTPAPRRTTTYVVYDRDRPAHWDNRHHDKRNGRNRH